eukprot:3992027-Amphidinium_carterae.1
MGCGSIRFWNIERSCRSIVFEWKMFCQPCDTIVLDFVVVQMQCVDFFDFVLTSILVVRRGDPKT